MLSSRWYPEIHSKPMASLLCHSGTWGQGENDSPTQKSVHSALESAVYTAHPKAQVPVKCTPADRLFHGRWLESFTPESGFCPDLRSQAMSHGTGHGSQKKTNIPSQLHSANLPEAIFPPEHPFRKHHSGPRGKKG